MRTRTESKVRPFFYFVFQEEILKDAPHTIFSAARIERQKLTELQNELASRLGTVADVIQRVLRRLEAEELIVVERRQIVIKDRAGLENQVE